LTAVYFLFLNVVEKIFFVIVLVIIFDEEDFGKKKILKVMFAMIK